MWNLDVDNIAHPHIFLEHSEIDPPVTGASNLPAVEGDGLSRRHDHFYFDDDNVVFQIENTSFKIHRYFFQRDSEIFASVFSLPDGPGQGPSDHNPIRLVGIQVKDFEIFLSILYPPKFGVYAATTVDEWRSVLDLAAKWKFQSIKTLAIEKLGLLAAPIDKIVLGRRHAIAEWLGEAYKSVCERPSALTLEEAERLGMEDVVKISCLRQEIRTPPPFGAINISADMISKTFGLGQILQDVSHASGSGNDQRELEVAQPVEGSLSPCSSIPPSPPRSQQPLRTSLFPLTFRSAYAEESVETPADEIETEKGRSDQEANESDLWGFSGASKKTSKKKGGKARKL